jgi:hypothetical protein
LHGARLPALSSARQHEASSIIGWNLTDAHIANLAACPSRMLI